MVFIIDDLAEVAAAPLVVEGAVEGASLVGRGAIAAAVPVEEAGLAAARGGGFLARAARFVGFGSKAMARGGKVSEVVAKVAGPGAGIQTGEMIGAVEDGAAKLAGEAGNAAKSVVKSGRGTLGKWFVGGAGLSVASVGELAVKAAGIIKSPVFLGLAAAVGGLYLFGDKIKSAIFNSPVAPPEPNANSVIVVPAGAYTFANDLPQRAVPWTQEVAQTGRAAVQTLR